MQREDYYDHKATTLSPFVQARFRSIESCHESPLLIHTSALSQLVSAADIGGSAGTNGGSTTRQTNSYII